MDINQKQFDRARENLAEQSLSDEKKQAILSDIYKQGSAPAQSGWGGIPLSRLFPARRVLAGALAVVLLLSGTTYAAAGSLPGDTLYGMKVNVLEPARLAFQFGQKEKAEYKLKLLEKRVEELKTLKQNSREQNKPVTDDSRQASRKATAETINRISATMAADQKDTRNYLQRKVKTYNRLVGANANIKLQLGTNASTDPAENRGSADPDGQHATASPPNIDNPIRSDDTDDTETIEVDATTDSTSTDTTENSQIPASTSVDTRINVGGKDPKASSTDSRTEEGGLPLKERKNESL
jgi:uncharacterized membrane protein